LQEVNNGPCEISYPSRHRKQVAEKVIQINQWL